MGKDNIAKGRVAVHNLAGQTFGRLTVVSFAGTRNKKRLWNCKCECGEERAVVTGNLVSGMTTSCGCMRREAASKRRLKSLAGRRFGRLRVVSISRERTASGRVKWHCLCDCGASKDIPANSLTSGRVIGCGCVQRESVVNRNTTHGKSQTAMYNAWKTMIGRCENSNHHKFQDYGARGIYVCERWHDYASFLEDVGPRPKGMTIDRIDNDGGYCCGKCSDCASRGIAETNCRWATASEQQLNKRNSRSA